MQGKMNNAQSHEEEYLDDGFDDDNYDDEEMPDDNDYHRKVQLL